MLSPQSRFLLRVLPPLFSLIVCAVPVAAQISSTWTNTGSATASWQTSGNWNNGVPAAAGDTASVIADITAPQTITLDGAVTLGGLTIGDPTLAGASSYTLAAGTYTAGQATLPGTLTFDVASGSATLTQTSTSSANLISAGITLADPLAITNSATTAALTLSGVIAGSGGITKAGVGPLLLSGTNTFSGGVTVTTGAVRVGNNAALGTGTLGLATGTTLSSNGTAARTLANALSLAGSLTLGDATNTGVLNFTGAGTLTANTTLTNASTVTLSSGLGDGGSGLSLSKAGAGTLFMGGVSTYTGGTTISAGTLELGGNNRLAGSGSVTVSGGSLDLGGFSQNVGSFTASSAVTVTAGTLVSAGSYAFTASSGTTTVDAALGGAGSLTKSNNGSLVLSGAGSFSGGSTISAGTVQVGSNTALGTAGVSLSDATLRASSTTARNLANALTLGGGVTLGASNSGALTFSSGTATLLASDTSLTNAIAVTLSAGVSDGGAGGRTFTKGGTGTLTLGGTSSVSGGLTINAGTVSVTGTLGSTPVTVNTGGTLTNAATNAVTGTVNLVGGTLSVTNPTSMGTLALSSGTVSGTGGLTTTGLTADPTGGVTATLSATLAGSGPLTKTAAGTLVVSGANAGYSGTVTLSDGVLQVGANSTLGSGTLSLAGGALMTSATTSRSLANLTVSFDGDVTLGDGTNTGALTFSNAGVLTGNRALTVPSAVTLSGALSGTGFGFTKLGAGTLTLSGANAYTGTTTVSAGSLAITAAADAGKTGTTNVDGGTLRLGNNAAIGEDTLVLTSGELMSNSSTARALGNAVTLAGNVTVGAGATYTGTMTFSGPVTLTGNRTLTTAVATTVSGAIADGGSAYRLTKNGSSTLTLSGANTYTGGTTISNGQLTFASGALPATGDVSILGGTLVSSGPYTTVADWLGSGRIAASPNGGIAITGNSNQAVNFSAYPTLSLGASATATYSGTYTPYVADGAPIYRLGGGAAQLTFSPVIANGTAPARVVVRGDTSSGVVRLGTSNTFTGGITLDSGTLDVSADTQLANVTGSGANTIVFEGGTLRYTTTTTDFSSKFAMPTANNQVSINTNGLTVAFATTITGAGGLNKSGAGTLTATAGYGGATSVSGGTLGLTLSATLPTGNLTTTGGTLQLIAPADRTLTATVAQRTGGVVELAPAAGQTLTLSGLLDRQTTTSAPGAISVASGTVRFTGTVSSVPDTNWTVSGGLLELANAATDQNNSIVSVAAGATVRLGGNDQIATSIAGLAGTFDLNGFSETLTSLAGSGTVTNSSTVAASTLTLTAASTVAARLTDSQTGAGSLALVISPTSASTVFTISNPANDYRGGTTMTSGVMAFGASNVLGSGGLVVVSGTLRGDGTDARTIGEGVTFSGNATLGNATQNGLLTFSGPVTLDGATRTLTAASDVTVSGNIGETGGTNGLSKAGAGLTVLSGANTYGGTTTVTAGTLRLAGSNSSAGGTTLNGSAATLQVAGGNVLASGTLTLTSGTLSSDSTTARAISNNLSFAGNVTLGDAANSGALTLSGAGSGTAMRTLTVVSDTTLSGALTGTLGLTKEGEGVLTITSASNAYTGGTRVNAGRVRVGSNAALGGVSGTVTLAGGALSSDGPTAYTLGNPISVTGNVTLGDAFDTGSLTLGGNTLLTGNRTITFASDVTLSGVMGEQGAGRRLTKAGPGTFTLESPVSYTGGTTLTAGRMRLGVAEALGTGTLILSGGSLSSDGATAREVANAFTLDGDVTLGNATDAGSLTMQAAGTLTGTRQVTVASNVTFAAAIGQSGGTHGLTKQGPGMLTLSAASTFTGPLTIDAGTVMVTSTGAVASGGSVRVNSGGTLAGGRTSGSSGGSVGRLTVASGGTVSPGNSPGALYSAAFEAQGGGNYNWQIHDVAGTAGAATGWDLIPVAGDLDLTGLSPGSRFNINTWTLSGVGPDVNGAPLNYDPELEYRFPIFTVPSLSSILLPQGFGQPVNDMDLSSLFAVRTSAINGTAGWAGSVPALTAVRIGLDGTSVDLVIVPEPGVAVLATVGFAVVAAVARGRAKSRRHR